VKPYLQLDNIIEAAFYTANRLFGLSFAERRDVPVYHPDVRVWEVTGADGRHVGVFLGDYFARPSKRSGAWMGQLRSQQKLAGDIRPIVVNVMNFSKAADGRPGPALDGGCPHPVPRVRPRPARALVRRHLSDDRRHQRGARLRRAPLAALRALARAGAGAAALCRALPHGQSRCPKALLERLLVSDPETWVTERT
jgi:hypothetical protein